MLPVYIPPKIGVTVSGYLNFPFGGTENNYGPIFFQKLLYYILCKKLVIMPSGFIKSVSTL